MSARTHNVQILIGLVQAVGLACPVGAHDSDILGVNLATNVVGAAGEGGNLRLVLGARDSAEVAEGDIGDGQRAGVLGAQCQVALAVALGDLDRVVYIVDNHIFIGHVVDAPRTAAAPVRVRLAYVSGRSSVDGVNSPGTLGWFGRS